MSAHPPTDVGNLERFAEAHAGRFLHVTGLGWLAFTGTHFDAEEGYKLLRAEAARVGELVEGDEAWRAKSEMSARIEAVARLAESDPRFAATVDELDSLSGSVNTLGGLLHLDPPEPDDGDEPYGSVAHELAALAVEPHDPAHRCTRVTGAGWDPLARAPFFEASVELALPDPDTRRYVQKAVGYALSGLGSKKVLPILAGASNAGKSGLVAAVTVAMGTYATAPPGSALVERRGFGDDKGHELMGLRGARLAVAAETSDGQSFNSDLVKRLTAGGQEKVRVRKLRQEWVEFANRAVIVVQTNSRPGITDHTEGLWNRIRLVPFPAAIPEGQRVEFDQLVAAFRSEAAGILRWMVEGFRMYRHEGLEPSAEMVKALDDYRLDEDWLEAFLRECCSREDTSAFVSTSELFRAYQAWSEMRGDRPATQNAFGRKVGNAKGVQSRRLRGHRGYDGIELLPGVLLKEPVVAGISREQAAWIDGQV